MPMLVCAVSHATTMASFAKQYSARVCYGQVCIWWRLVMLTVLGVVLQHHQQRTAWCWAMFWARRLLSRGAAAAARIGIWCMVGVAVVTVLVDSAAAQYQQDCLATCMDSVLQALELLWSRAAASALEMAAAWWAHQLFARLLQAAMFRILVYYSTRRAQTCMSQLQQQQQQEPKMGQKGLQQQQQQQRKAASWQLPEVCGSWLIARSLLQAATSTHKQLQDQHAAWQQRYAADSHTVEGCASSICASNHTATGSGTAAAGSDAAVVQPGSIAYQSCFQRKLVAIKLQEPPGTGVVELEAVRQQLQATLQTALCAGSVPTPAATCTVPTTSTTHRGLQCQHLPFVSQSVAFRGCYQLVFEVVRPVNDAEPQDGAAAAVAAGIQAGSAELEQQQLLHLQQFLEQQVKHQLPDGWRLRGVQMVGQQQALHDCATISLSPSTAAAAAATVAVSQPPKWSLGGSAIAADNLAAALACLWSRDTKPEQAIILQPLAAALQAAAAAGMPGADGGAGSSRAAERNTATPAVVEAELLLPKALVQHLLQQGHQRVRCVVAAQPEGVVLFDKAWPLLPEAGADPPASAAATAAGDMSVQLQFSLDGVHEQRSAHSSTQLPVRVLSVVVLGKEGKRGRRGYQQGQQLAPGNSLEAEPAAAAAVAGASVPGVVAHLPLLVLPAAAAATEMQCVIDKAAAVGIDRRQAVQELLLPLIQDWALLVLLSGGSSSSSNNKPKHPLQHMQQSLYDSLASFFAHNKMEHCQKLLPTAAGLASKQVAISPRSDQQQLQEAPPAAAAGVHGSRCEQQQPPQHASYSVDFYLYTFKIANCTAQHPHDWSTCPFVHPREKARRRDPRLFEYDALPCPVDKKGSNCPQGDACRYTHNVYEFHLHPKRFRTQMCQNGAACKRSLCFFAHSLDELRVVEPQEQEQQQQQMPSMPTEAAGTAVPSAPEAAAAAPTVVPVTVLASPPPAAAVAAPAAPGSAAAAAAASVAAAAAAITTSIAAAASSTASTLANALAALDLKVPLLNTAAATIAAPRVPAEGHGLQSGRGSFSGAVAGTPGWLPAQQQLQQQQHIVVDSRVTASGLAMQPQLLERFWLQRQQLQQSQQQPQEQLLQQQQVQQQQLQQLGSSTLYNTGLLYQQAPAAVAGTIPQLQQQQQVLFQLQQQLAPSNAASFLPDVRAQVLTPRSISSNPGSALPAAAVFGLQQQPQQQQQWVGGLGIAIPAVQQQGYPFELAVAGQPQQQLLLGPVLYESQPQGAVDAHGAVDATHFYNLLQ